jgi:phosphoesterase RecJ-like protein
MKIDNLNKFCKKLKSKLENSSKILIVSHRKPDPDCLFSQLALYYLLKKNYPTKTIILFNKDYFYEKDILKNINDDLKLIQNKINESPNEIDLIIGIETTDEERLGLEKKFIDYNKVFIIDHHASFSIKESVYYLEENADSCSVIIFKLAEFFNFKLTSKFKLNILTGIIGDTVGLRYIKNKETFKILEKLYDEKIDLFAIIKKIYGFKFSEFKKLIFLIDKIKIYYKKRFMLIYLEKNKRIKRLGSFLEYLRLITDIETIALLVKKKNKIYGSLRSEKINVGQIAKKLGGGGHKYSAGFISELSVKKIVKYILNNLE